MSAVIHDHQFRKACARNGVKGNGVVIGQALLHYQRRGIRHVSCETLAKYCGLCLRTVKSWIQRFERMGWLVQSARKWWRGRDGTLKSVPTAKRLKLEAEKTVADRGATSTPSKEPDINIRKKGVPLPGGGALLCPSLAAVREQMALALARARR